MRRDELSLPEPPNNDRPGDRWMCGRNDSQRPCSQGPNRYGSCPLADACRPRLTWHGRRKQITTIAITLMVVLFATLFQQRWRAAAFKPGELATPHAQILAGTLTSQRCATCHAEASTSIPQWFSQEVEGHLGVSQTDRCLNCHHRTIDRSNATLAHNLPLAAREAIRLASARPLDHSWHDLLPSPVIDQENIQCNACHREHGGADNDLSAVSDAQCQSCHADRFGSFASAHPDWDQWPYGRGRNIAFHHASHLRKHFPATKHGDVPTQFQCADCHHRTSNNELTRITTYERGCKSCHEQRLQIQTSDGIELFALPTLPAESADRVAAWPDTAVGFFDGVMSPLVELCLRSEPGIEQSIRQIPESDFGRIDDRQIHMVQAAEQVAEAYLRLLDDISLGGQQAIKNRIRAAGVTPASAAAFVQSMPTQLVTDARRFWFQIPATATSANKVQFKPFRPPTAAKPDDDLLLVDALEDDSSLIGDDDLLLEEEPLSQSDLRLPTQGVQQRKTDRFDPDGMLTSGGWYRDDLTLAIRYRGGGHADPVLKATIELISQFPISDPVRQRLLKNQAIDACVSCHVGALTASGAWHSQPLIGQRREFTKFTHSPHLNIAQLADCAHCHEIGSWQEGADQASTVSAANVPDSHDFAPIKRQACAGCHTPQAAGDACIKCHRYHIGLR